MTEPTRLTEEAGTDDLESALLRLARRDGPSGDSRQRILAALGASGAASLATPPARASALPRWTLPRGLLLTAAVASIPAALLLSSRPTAGPPPVHVPAAPTSAAAPRPEAPAPRPEAPAPAPPTVDTPPPRAELPLSRSGTTSGKPPQASLAEEVAQLKKAKLALKSGDAGKALSELDTYASRFPRPILAAEATVLRIESLSRRGDAARARALAEAFLAKHPDSPYAARLRGFTAAP